MRGLSLLQVVVGLACGVSCVEGAQGRAVSLAVLFAVVSAAGGLVRAWEGR